MGQELGYKNLDDWYALSQADLKAHLSSLSRFPLPQLVQELFPDQEVLPWKFRRTPPGFWENQENRKRYYDWLRPRLNFSTAEDWYALTGEMLNQNYGASIAQRMSIEQIASEANPGFKYLSWRFNITPKNYWNHIANRLHFMKWLEKELNVQNIEDWYKINSVQVEKLGSITRAWPLLTLLKELHPTYEFLPWRFNQVAPGFWTEKSNRIRYMKWLGERLGYRTTADWRQLTNRLLNENYGSTLAQQFQTVNLIAEYFKEIDGQTNSKDGTSHPWELTRVPRSFWSKRENRVRYMTWLAQRLGLQQPTDWYQVDKHAFEQNYGATIIQKMSKKELVQELYPDFDFKPWLFRTVPKQFWSSQTNRKEYLDWLGEALGFQSVEDWYKLTSQDLINHYGSTLIGWMDLKSIVKEAVPNYDFKPWLFNQTSHNYFADAENRFKYMKYLEAKLGYVNPEDWYRVGVRDFIQNNGAALVAKHGVHVLVQELYPDYEFLPWKFQTAPDGFWNEKKNRLRFLVWLQNELGVKNPEDWYAISRETISKNGGRSLGHIPIESLASELFPDFQFDKAKFYSLEKSQKALYQVVRKILENEEVLYNSRVQDP